MDMHSYKRLFSLLKVNAPNALVEAVLARLARERRRAARSMYIWSGALVLSVIGVVGSVAWAGSEVSLVNLSHLMSMVFSDSALVFTYWKDFAYALLESLPYMSMAGMCLMLGLGIFSVARIKNVLTIKQSYDLQLA